MLKPRPASYNFSNYNGGTAWNQAGLSGKPLQFFGPTDDNLMYMDGVNDTVAFGTSETTVVVNGITVKPKIICDRQGGNSNINFMLISKSDTASAGAFMVGLRASASGGIVQNGWRGLVFRSDMNDGSGGYITNGDFSFQVDSTPSLGIVPVTFAVRLMDSTGTLETKFSVSSSGIFHLNPGGGADISLFPEGGLRGNRNANSDATADFIWGGADYSNLVRMDVSANQFNLGTATQGAIMSADADDLEVRFNKTNAGVNVVVESSTPGTDLWDADGATNTITQGKTILTGRFQGLKGADSASGTTVTLGDGNLFDVTGTTTINHVTTTDWQDGSVVILQFDASVTVTHNAATPPANTAPILLSGAGNFSATAGDTLQLVLDGSNWREVSRTII